MSAQKPANGVDVVITGIGMASCLGVGAQANWQALASNAKPTLDAERFAPTIVHPLPEIDWSEQIPKRGDQRQMETWQRIGTYVAGLALQDAGIKDNEALTSTMDMIVAAAGGERDQVVDAMILEKAGSANDRGAVLNEILTTELRPTLFLAQLSNLLAGNISIVHKVTGSSRTFMGEEGSGISAVLTAAARIRSGQSTHMLVGASYNCEHPDMLLGLELGGDLHHGDWAPVYDRPGTENGGVVPGSGGVFLVLESADHAKARGATAYASLNAVSADHGSADTTAARLDALAADVGLQNGTALYSAASGAKQRTKIEKDWAQARGLETTVVTDATGHLREAQFPLAIAAAALAVKHDNKPSVAALTIGVRDAEGLAILGSA